MASARLSFVMLADIFCHASRGIDGGRGGNTGEEGADGDNLAGELLELPRFGTGLLHWPESHLMVGGICVTWSICLIKLACVGV